jgi:putative transposase
VKVVELIEEARAAGARLRPACKIVGISERTYQRWTKDGFIKEDLRTVIDRPTPKIKLTKAEWTKVIEITNSCEYADLPPCKIIPMLADKGDILHQNPPSTAY